MRTNTILTLILVCFIALGTVYSVVVPPFEASDELWHYPMVRYIADHWSLPVQDPANVGPWRQEGSQPPLYYVLAAAATFWIDTSDMEAVRHLNPHVDNGVATPDGNINLVVHHPAREAFPWRGTVLAVHLIRLLSVLMGAAAVYLTYLIACEVLPGQPGLALGAAAVHAFTPMFVFISGAVNNDNLVVPLSALALLMLLRLVRQRPAARLRLERLPGKTSHRALVALAGVPVRHYLILGVVLGLAVLTKTSALALAVITAVVVVVRAVRRRSWAEFLVGGLATLLPMLAICGWWFLRNLRLYGDLTGFSAFFEILGIRDVPADPAQLWRERFSFMAGYWGNFGGLNVPMSAWAYGVLNAVVVVAAVGLLVLLGRRIDRRETGPTIRAWPLALCLFLGAGVFLPWLLSWARITWSSQGRLIFPAISVWSLLLVMGLSGWLPRAWRGWAVAAFALLLFGLVLATPFVWIRPAYCLPAQLTEQQVAAIPQRLDLDFGGVMRLLGYDLEADEVEPGGQVVVTLYWEALGPAAEDHTVFVHLLGEGELLVAQRDTFPGRGLLSATWLEPGARWADRYVLQLPDTAFAPDVAQIEVGLVVTASGERVPVGTPDGQLLGGNVRFGRVEVHPREGDVPNPVWVDFGDRMALVGYDLDRRVVRPGETVTLTLYWQGLRPMDANYTVSAQLVDSDQRKAAQLDGWPADGVAPTATWEPGWLQTDVRTLEVYADAPPGPYDVRLAVYVLQDGAIVHLPVVPTGGRMASDHVVLTRVRVGP